MASETSSNRYRERTHTHTHDRVIIQDYGQFVNPTTTSLVLPRPKKEEETKADRLPATWDLFQAVNWARCEGLLGNTATVDFSSELGAFLARGGFFQTRRFPAQRVAKYPLVPDATGVLPKSTYLSLLTELRILSHPPLMEHGGICSFWRRLNEELRKRGETLGPLLPSLSGPGHVLPDGLSNNPRSTNYVFQAVALRPFHERLAHGGKGWLNAMGQTLLVLRDFDLATKLPISVLPQLLHPTGCSTAILKLLSEDDFLEGTSDPAKFWADVAEEIIPTEDTTTVLHAMKRAKKYSADSRLPNTEKLLELCTESFSCDASVVDAIAGEGVKVDFPTQQGRTPLMGAVLHRNFEIASALIRHGADVNVLWKPIFAESPEEKDNPDANILCEYVASNLDTVIAPLRYLLEPLHSKKDSVPSFIVIPRSKSTALHLACRNGNPLIVGYLLQKFNTPYHLDFVDIGSLTALHYAVLGGQVEIARMLCQAGARVDILTGNESLDPKDRQNALDYCHLLFALNIRELQHDSPGIGRDIEDVYLGRLEIAKILVRERQAVRTVGSRDEDGMVWSFKLCLYAAQENMTRLLRGALENLRNDAASGMSWQEALDQLLVHAVVRGHAGTTKLLVDHGANVNQLLPIDSQAALLHEAVARSHAEVVYVLLRAGADVNAYDKEGWPPFKHALRLNDLATCRVLKHFGGSITLGKDYLVRRLADSGVMDMEAARTFLQGQNLHMTVKLEGEPSDDDTEGEEEDDTD